VSKDSLARSAHRVHLVGFKDLPNPGYFSHCSSGNYAISLANWVAGWRDKLAAYMNNHLSLAFMLTASLMSQSVLSKDTPSAPPTAQNTVEDLENQQRALASQIKQQLDELPDSPKRQGA
jgi:hypothetical protein